jgi:hypothetical protein
MYFLTAAGTEPVRSLQESLGSERILWTGRCAVAEYAFDEPASLPRWTLPEETGVVVTETRVVFVDPAARGGGELHWLWPQHLRVQPGNRDTGRSATVTQIQLVCNGPAGVFPALVFAGGDLATVGDADRLANVLRQSIARFRVEHSGELGLTAPQTRMLSRLVIGPEFNNFQGGEGQTVTLLGSMTVEEAVGARVPGPVGLSWEQEPFLDEYLPPDGRAVPLGEQSAFAAGADGYAGASGAEQNYAALGDGYGAEHGTAAAQGNGYRAEHGAPAWDGYGGDQGAYVAEREYEPHPYAEYRAAPQSPAAPRSQPTPQPLTPPQPHAAPEPQPLLAPQPQPLLAPRPLRASEPVAAPRPQPVPRPVRAAEPEHTDLASRAADLAARVASLVSANAGAEQTLERYETQTTNLSSFLAEGGNGHPADGQPRVGDDGRAESVRRTAARFAGNSARARATGQRPAGDDHGTRQRNA